MDMPIADGSLVLALPDRSIMQCSDELRLLCLDTVGKEQLAELQPHFDFLTTPFTRTIGQLCGRADMWAEIAERVLEDVWNNNGEGGSWYEEAVSCIWQWLPVSMT